MLQSKIYILHDDVVAERKGEKKGVWLVTREYKRKKVHKKYFSWGK